MPGSHLEIVAFKVVIFSEIYIIICFCMLFIRLVLSMRYYYVTIGICLVFSFNLVSYYMYCLCFACLSIVWLLYTVLSLIIIFKLSFCWNEIKIISNNFKNYIYEINFYLFSGPHSNKGHLPEPYRATDSIPPNTRKSKCPGRKVLARQESLYLQPDRELWTPM